MLGLGLAYYLKGELSDAARFLERAIEIRPPTTNLLNALGEVYVGLDLPVDARRVFEKSLALDPTQESIQKRLTSLKEACP